MPASGGTPVPPGKPDEIHAAGDWARGVLESKHKARETTLSSGRKTIQACQASIRAVHGEQSDTAEELSAQAAAHLAEALGAVEHHPDIRHAGFVHDASKEYAEARMTLAFVRGDPLPKADELVGVEVQAYLNGMAEAASELRRYILDLLRRGRPQRGAEPPRAKDEGHSPPIPIHPPPAP